MLLVTTALWLFVWGGNLCQRGLSFHAFPPSFPTTSSRGLARLSMKWTFTKGTASAKDLGLVGDDGELYFHPTKQATIDLPADMPLYSSYVPKKDIVSKVYDIPVFPVTNLIGPGSKEWMNVYEMKYRHLISTVSKLYLCYYSLFVLLRR